MNRTAASLLAFSLVAAEAACGGGSRPAAPDGAGSAIIEGATFTVSNLQLTMETEDPSYFRIEGDDAAHRDEDCLPGLGGGLALYGDLPSGVTSASDLAGREIPFEFSGDGDDFNLCFVGSNGLLGVERGTVRFTAVSAGTVSFSFSGEFIRYDGAGGESPGTISAAGEGTARVSEN
jgi:hypothetical protein